jgi:hypothetical protein
METESISEIETSLTTIYQRALVRRFLIAIADTYHPDYAFALSAIKQHLQLLIKIKHSEESVSLLEHLNKATFYRNHIGFDAGALNIGNPAWQEAIMNNSDWLTLLEDPVRAYLGEPKYSLW